MRRRNLIVTSDSDKEDGEGTATTASASAVASVASGSGSVGRSSAPNPSPVPFPSLSPPSDTVVISDDEEEEEEEIEEILDSDGDSPFVDASEDVSPPAPAPPTPPAAGTSTPVRTPTPTPPPAGIPTPGSTSNPTPASTRTPILTSAPARTPTTTPAPARTPTPTPPPSGAPPPGAHSRSTPPPSALSGRLRPVDEFLKGLGLWLRPEWLESCATGVPGFDGLGGAEAQTRRCFEQFLFADMNTCGAGVLPEGVGSMHTAVLDGPFVLQVDEIVNISAPLRERYRDTHAGPKRCLKLSMTDGIQRIFGMEYRPIKDLQVLAPAGLKIVLRNVHIRRGLLMLVPEVIQFLGGVVDELEEARGRLVSEVNKPPRGKRSIDIQKHQFRSVMKKQGGLPLSSRATLAAWPCSTNVTNGGGQAISAPQTVNPSHPTGLGNAFQVGRTTETLVEEHIRPPVMVSTVREQSRHVQEINMQDLSTSLTRNNTETSGIPQYDRTHTIQEQSRHVQEINMQDLSTSLTRNNTETSAIPQYDRTRTIIGQSRHVQDINMKDLSTSLTQNNTETTAILNEYSRTQTIQQHSQLIQEINMQDLSASLTRNNTETFASIPQKYDHKQTITEGYVDPYIIANNSHEQAQSVHEVSMQEQANAFVRTEERLSTSASCGYDSHHGLHAVGDTDANDAEAGRSSNVDDEINNMEHSMILSGENEKPFTYMISMLADWGAQQDTKDYIQGKIKGLITCVKSFQYKKRTEYELYVYIDDGSYISTALLDHDIVKNWIGLSPEEVTAVLSGESMLASASAMKQTLRGLQSFLVKFEGMMLIEFNKTSSVPVIRELNEGCMSSDAWLLLGRVKRFSSQRRMQSLDVMDTTP
ncbi:hypothetical protein EJB05_39218, partial [Eragrostis curvula]